MRISKYASGDFRVLPRLPSGTISVPLKSSKVVVHQLSKFLIPLTFGDCPQVKWHMHKGTAWANQKGRKWRREALEPPGLKPIEPVCTLRME